MAERENETDRRTEAPAKKPVRTIQLEEFLQTKEKEGPIPGKVKDLFRVRAAASTDFQRIWEGLWK